MWALATTVVDDISWIRYCVYLLSWHGVHETLMIYNHVMWFSDSLTWSFSSSSSFSIHSMIPNTSCFIVRRVVSCYYLDSGSFFVHSTTKLSRVCVVYKVRCKLSLSFKLFVGFISHTYFVYHYYAYLHSTAAKGLLPVMTFDFLFSGFARLLLLLRIVAGNIIILYCCVSYMLSGNPKSELISR